MSYGSLIALCYNTRQHSITHQTHYLQPEMSSHRFCLAPMMDWSDRHCRYFWRLMSKHARLYTEMITTGALLHGDAERHLRYNKEEHPIAVQLGGSNPADLAKSANLCEKAGYDEVNLNVGCPSERVQNGAFGACLMNEPNLVADCIKAMQDAVNIPVTIKCRIGVDDNDSYEALCQFVETNKQAGCKVFIIHARKAWLSGLSPKQNREVPPLNYPTVFKIKNDFPDLTVILNGGIKTMDGCEQAIKQLDGVMIGREAYQNPFMLAEVDKHLFNDNQAYQTPLEVAKDYANYIEQELSQGAKLNHITRHILGLFNGRPRAKQWRRFLSENAYKTGAGLDTYLESLALFAQDRLEPVNPMKNAADLY